MSHVGEDLTERPAELPKSYYEVLGVPSDATAKQIRNTYYNLAKNYHPDKCGDVDATQFALVGEAYQVLKDPALRLNYDLMEMVKQGFRLGVLAAKHTDAGVKDVAPSAPRRQQMAFYLDRAFADLYWQEEAKGPVLLRGYSRCELRYVAFIYAGEDDNSLLETLKLEGMAADLVEATRRRCLCMRFSPQGLALGYATVHMELDTERARDDILDGLRVLRCTSPMLFQQNLDKLKEQGLR